MKGSTKFFLDWSPIAKGDGPFGTAERTSSCLPLFRGALSPNVASIQAHLCIYVTKSSSILLDQTRFYTTPHLELVGASTPEDRAFLMDETSAKATTRSAWLQDPTGKHIQTVGRSASGGWTLEQTWVFEMIGGKRYYTRRTMVTNGKKTSRARWVYDFVGA